MTQKNRILELLVSEAHAAVGGGTHEPTQFVPDLFRCTDSSIPLLDGHIENP